RFPAMAIVRMLPAAVHRAAVVGELDRATNFQLTIARLPIAQHAPFIVTRFDVPDIHLAVVIEGMRAIAAAFGVEADDLNARRFGIADVAVEAMHEKLLSG